MTIESSRAAARMGQLVAENDILRQQIAQANASPDLQVRYTANEIEILECQITLQKSRIAARPEGTSSDLEAGLAKLVKARDELSLTMTGDQRKRGIWRPNVRRVASLLGRS